MAWSRERAATGLSPSTRKVCNDGNDSEFAGRRTNESSARNRRTLRDDKPQRLVTLSQLMGKQSSSSSFCQEPINREKQASATARSSDRALTETRKVSDLSSGQSPWILDRDSGVDPELQTMLGIRRDRKRGFSRGQIGERPRPLVHTKCVRLGRKG